MSTFFYGFCGLSPKSTQQAAESGHKLYSEGHLSDAILSFSEVAEDVRHGDDQPACCRDLYIGGNACLESNRFIEALEFYTLALEIARKNKCTKDITGLLVNIGVIYSIFRDYEKSIHYYHQAFEELQKQPDENVMPIVLANLVNSYSKAGHPDEARKYLKLQAQHPLSDKAVHQYHIYYNQGIIAAADQNPRGNLFCQQKALDVIDANGLSDLMRTDVLDEMGHAYADLGCKESALSTYKKCCFFLKAADIYFRSMKLVARLLTFSERRAMPILHLSTLADKLNLQIQPLTYSHSMRPKTNSTILKTTLPPLT